MHALSDSQPALPGEHDGEAETWRRGVCQRHGHPDASQPRYRHTHTHACSQTYSTHTDSHTHPYMHGHTHTNTRARAYTFPCRHIHTQSTHRHMHAHTHTHTALCVCEGHLRIQRSVQSAVRVRFGENLHLDWDGRGRVLLKVGRQSHR